jgi:putative tricarboxylic transport membrane protein
MKKTGLRCIMVWLVGILMVTAGGYSPAQAAVPFPDKPVEFVVQVGAGGASDVFVRNVTRMITEQKLITVPITINNKEGGGGAIAANYMKGKEGNPYYIMHTAGTFISAVLRDPSVPGYKDFTPVARMTIEVTCACVRTDSPFKTIKDVVDKAKAGKPGEINWAGTGVGSVHHLPITMLEDLTGTKYSFISFTGTNEVTAALLGKHADVGFMEPGAAKPQVDAGKLRVLAVSGDQRVGALPNSPTFKEQGYNVIIYSHRGFVASGKISDDAKNVYSGVFAKLTQSSQWKEYMTKSGSEGSFLPADEYRNFFVEESAKWQKLMKAAKIIK